MAHDDLGHEVALPARSRRIVSLVPSLTEAVASCGSALLAGATKYCTHPAGLAVERIGGTKNPDVPRIVALAPDLVLANEEENREADLAALRAAGLAVWVTRIRDLPQALASLETMLTFACGFDRPAWLDTAAAAWKRASEHGASEHGASEHGASEHGAGGHRAIIPIWRRPWMVVGSDTFAGDLLARLGVANVYADHPERYPKVSLADLRESGADLVVLPDEPYAFSASDGPEAFVGLPVALVSGRHLTWYGPSLAQAPDVLTTALARAALAN